MITTGTITLDHLLIAAQVEDKQMSSNTIHVMIYFLYFDHN